MSQPQLLMLLEDTSKLPPLFLPAGYTLHNHVEGRDEPIWERIVEDSFGSFFSFEGFLIKAGGYKPEHVLYISVNGEDISTTTAVENPNYPGYGWLRMVATSPAGRSKGCGRLVVLAALQQLAARGYKQVLLSTDDFRLPAISLYRSLGFKPYCNHESHAGRWEKVLSELQVISSRHKVN